MGGRHIPGRREQDKGWGREVTELFGVDKTVQQDPKHRSQREMRKRNGNRLAGADWEGGKAMLRGSHAVLDVTEAM